MCHKTMTDIMSVTITYIICQALQLKILNYVYNIAVSKKTPTATYVS